MNHLRRCLACKWTGVPTYLRGREQNECPACHRKTLR